jgi:structural maintenance of chromosome 3 (chondroitin sulfate proteoglycan 6)
LQEKSLANTKSQIDQLKAGMAMKRAEMGTDLIDHLTPEEKDLLSQLNPEITKWKDMHMFAEICLSCTYMINP